MTNGDFLVRRRECFDGLSILLVSKHEIYLVSKAGHLARLELELDVVLLLVHDLLKGSHGGVQLLHLLSKHKTLCLLSKTVIAILIVLKIEDILEFGMVPLLLHISYSDPDFLGLKGRYCSFRLFFIRFFLTLFENF